jgi:CRP-like cAMP-binding protein
VIPASEVAAAVRRHPEVAVVAIAHLARVIGELSAEIEALRKHGLIERVRHRLAVLGRGRRAIAITHGQLAEEVGGTRANVSRALARLEREGVVVRRRGVIELTER